MRFAVLGNILLQYCRRTSSTSLLVVKHICRWIPQRAPFGPVLQSFFGRSRRLSKMVTNSSLGAARNRSRPVVSWADVPAGLGLGANSVRDKKHVYAGVKKRCDALGSGFRARPSKNLNSIVKYLGRISITERIYSFLMYS
jgi:hypothetical protein